MITLIQKWSLLVRQTTFQIEIKSRKNLCQKEKELQLQIRSQAQQWLTKRPFQTAFPGRRKICKLGKLANKPIKQKKSTEHLPKVTNDSQNIQEKVEEKETNATKINNDLSGIDGFGSNAKI